MKKIIQALSTHIIFLPTTVFAIASPGKPNDVPSDLSTAITTISNTILLIIGAIAVLFLIVGGFQYVTSAGSPDNVSKAKNTILYAIIGIIFAILAYAIVNFVVTKLSPAPPAAPSPPTIIVMI
jgi:lysylphosphatidylglycerol synthetase-like protein (DUF2156 family)